MPIAPDELLCVYEDSEFDADGKRMTTGVRQWHGVRVKAARV